MHSLYYGVVKVEVAELAVKISDLYVSSEFDLPRIWYFLRTAFKKGMVTDAVFAYNRDFLAF